MIISDTQTTTLNSSQSITSCSTRESNCNLSFQNNQTQKTICEMGNSYTEKNGTINGQDDITEDENRPSISKKDLSAYHLPLNINANSEMSHSDEEDERANREVENLITMTSDHSSPHYNQPLRQRAVGMAPNKTQILHYLFSTSLIKIKASGNDIQLTDSTSFPLIDVWRKTECFSSKKMILEAYGRTILFITDTDALTTNMCPLFCGSTSNLPIEEQYNDIELVNGHMTRSMNVKHSTITSYDGEIIGYFASGNPFLIYDKQKQVVARLEIRGTDMPSISVSRLEEREERINQTQETSLTRNVNEEIINLKKDNLNCIQVGNGKNSKRTTKCIGEEHVSGIWDCYEVSPNSANTKGRLVANIVENRYISYLSTPINFSLKLLILSASLQLNADSSNIFNTKSEEFGCTIQ
uniref:Phospholipid scramblase n=1 Tax=Rhabditophanes sp. KR3021 TaxID=114890 RepID=A0AC35UH98_9BILA